jgi:hypothetical protein
MRIAIIERKRQRVRHVPNDDICSICRDYRPTRPSSTRYTERTSDSWSPTDRNENSNYPVSLGCPRVPFMQGPLPDIAIAESRGYAQLRIEGMGVHLRRCEPAAAGAERHRRFPGPHGTMTARRFDAAQVPALPLLQKGLSHTAHSCRPLAVIAMQRDGADAAASPAAPARSRIQLSTIAFAHRTLRMETPGTA